MKKIALAFSVAFALSGCGLIQQYQYQKQQQENIDQAKAQLKAINERCAGTLKSDSRLDPLRPHINFDGTESIEQFASTKKPNAKEKQAILAFDEIASGCFADRAAVFRNAGAPAYLAQNTNEFAAAAKQAKANLWAGNYTYGMYLKVAQQNFQNAEKGRIDGEQAEQQRQQQAQMQQAQINAVNAQANAAMMSAQAQQQVANNQSLMMFNQAQRQMNAPGSPGNPVQTNCNRMGNSVNCQTYSY